MNGEKIVMIEINQETFEKFHENLEKIFCRNIFKSL